MAGAGLLIEPTITEIVSATAAGLVVLLTGLGLGVRKGRAQAVNEGDPEAFSKAWMERAERSFKKTHDDASILTEHGFKLTLLEGAIKRIEGELLVHSTELTDEIRLLSGSVNGLREDLASLRGEMGYERRRKHEVGGE